eukprot:GHVU01198551.1.p1 GENE.GHVU01198551.1~~GHVU01198551.1.p1  ORF type:complete len:134 (-),score=2.05 GHVU01198551.1:96-497(-)
MSVARSSNRSNAALAAGVCCCRSIHSQRAPEPLKLPVFALKFLGTTARDVVVARGGHPLEKYFVSDCSRASNLYCGGRRWVWRVFLGEILCPNPANSRGHPPRCTAVPQMSRNTTTVDEVQMTGASGFSCRGV